MKSYRTKDLSITVLPEQRELEDCLWDTKICLAPTGVCPRDATICPGLSDFCGVTDFCGLTPRCFGNTGLCPPLTDCGVNYSYPVGPPQNVPVTVRNADDLEQLKGQLQDTMDRLEEVDAEELGGGAREVTSVEEAEALEERLGRALKEVQTRKQELASGKGGRGG